MNPGFQVCPIVRILRVMLRLFCADNRSHYDTQNGNHVPGRSFKVRRHGPTDTRLKWPLTVKELVHLGYGLGQLLTRQ